VSTIKEKYHEKNTPSRASRTADLNQGDTIEAARDNLQEALELFFEAASPEEIEHRLHEPLEHFSQLC
jgi:predicted RNase H-like HicB family nuclease